jgi:hypothetical protein
MATGRQLVVVADGAGWLLLPIYNNSDRTPAADRAAADVFGGSIRCQVK